jgi:hypothetical protein
LDARSTPPEYLNLFFPGQLLITGTVFLPSLIVVLLVIVLSASIKLARIPKDFMIARGWSLPRVEIRLEPGGMSAFYFRCVNVIMSVIIPGVIAAAIWDSLKWLIFFSR